MAVVDIYSARGALNARTQQEIDQQERERAESIARCWGYYDGGAPEQLKVRPGDYNDNVRLNYCKLIVDTSVSFLFGQEVSFESEDDATQELLDFAWGASEQRMVTLARLGVNGAIAGHAYVRLQALDNGTCRVIVLDPSNVTVEWAADDFSKVQAYVVEWTGYDEQLEKAVSFRQDVRLMDYEMHGPWMVTDSRSVGGGGWVVTDENLWDFPFAPIVDCQNMPTANEFYGMPDLDGSNLDLIDRIDGAASNIQKILRYHAHPKVFIYGYTGKEIDLSSDTAVNFPSNETQVDILGMPTDLASAFTMLDRLTEELFRLTRTPKAALGDSDAAALAASGLALKLGFMPLVDKTSTKRQTYGHMLNEINDRVQAVAGKDPVEVELNWPTITPDDPMGDAQTAILKLQVGVSKRTVLGELGYDPDIEEQQSADEQQAAAEALAAQMPDAFGDSKVVNEDSQGASTRDSQMKRRSRDMGA